MPGDQQKLIIEPASPRKFNILAPLCHVFFTLQCFNIIFKTFPFLKLVLRVIHSCHPSLWEYGMCPVTSIKNIVAHDLVAQ